MLPNPITAPLCCREALPQPSSSSQQRRPPVSAGQCLVKAETQPHSRQHQGQGQRTAGQVCGAFPGGDIRRGSETKRFWIGEGRPGSKWSQSPWGTKGNGSQGRVMSLGWEKPLGMPLDTGESPQPLGGTPLPWGTQTPQWEQQPQFPAPQQSSAASFPSLQLLDFSLGCFFNVCDTCLVRST